MTGRRGWGSRFRRLVVVDAWRSHGEQVKLAISVEVSVSNECVDCGEWRAEVDGALVIREIDGSGKGAVSFAEAELDGGVAGSDYIGNTISVEVCDGWIADGACDFGSKRCPVRTVALSVADVEAVGTAVDEVRDAIAVDIQQDGGAFGFVTRIELGLSACVMQGSAER